MGRKIVILMGHPGVGKGTQARAIMQRLNIPQISTGDMLREAIAKNTTYGRAAKARMESGDLVSDAIVNGIVAERIRRDDCENGFILDGYPRTVRQAETFQQESAPDDDLFVIEIGANSVDLTNRLTGRWICTGCGEIYNTYSRAPKVKAVCDICGWTLFHRSDDREELVRERFRTYKEETYPLVEYYKQIGIYHQVDGMKPVEQVTQEILSIVDDKKDPAPAVSGGT